MSRTKIVRTPQELKELERKRRAKYKKYYAKYSKFYYLKNILANPDYNRINNRKKSKLKK